MKPKQASFDFSKLNDDVPAGKTDTSEAAFESIKGKPRGKGQTKVLAHILSMGKHGATNEEMTFALGMRMQTVSARANDLWRAGLIKDSGERRKTTTGRKAKVWVTHGALS